MVTASWLQYWRMGHAAVSKPSSPELGQVELGVEALQILNSLEEYSSPVTLMLSSHSPSPQRTPRNSSVRKRIFKRRYFTWEDEENVEDESATPSSLSPLPPPKFETVSIM